MQPASKAKPAEVQFCAMTDPTKNMVVIQNPDAACPDAFVIA